MMDFAVQPAALRELAASLDRARVDLDGVRKYLSKMETFEGGEGYLGYCLSGHRQAYTSLTDWINEFGNTVSGTSAAITSAAAYYERTDEAAAAQVDATYPGGNVPAIRQQPGYGPIESEGTARFADPVTSSAMLEEPHDYSREMYGQAMDWWDSLSVMSTAAGAIQSVSEIAVWLGWLDKPFHPIKEITESFVGDWAGARAAADILRNAGRAVTYVGLNLQWASQGCEQVWHGNAGDGATVYLAKLARRLDVDNSWPPLDTLAEQYVNASADMVLMRDAVVSILSSIGDYAIEVAVVCGISASASATGVGSVVAGAALFYCGYQVARVVDGITEILDLIGKLKTATNALSAAQGGFAGPGTIAMPHVPPPPADVPR